MNKNDFTNELKELMSSMSEEEIEKTINALSGCKSAVYKKNNQEKGEKARLLSTTERHEAELHYVGERKKEGTLKAVGASLLTSCDFDLLRSKLPSINDNWWLYDKYRVSNNNRNWSYDSATGGKIRPVIVIDDINGNLEPGEVFYINDEKFKLLTPSLAIKSACFEDLCTYSATNYECSILRLCVDGWYMKLIKENETHKLEISNGT